MTVSELFSGYDLFLVDMFGVIWDGVSWIDGTMEALATLVKMKKSVIILSNASMATAQMLKKYAPAFTGIRQGVQFSDFVTSGEVLGHILRSGALSFSSVKSPKTYALFGNQNCSSFQNTEYVRANSIDEADFIYASIPQLYSEQKALLSKELQDFLIVSNMRPEDELVWDSTSIEPFLGPLEELALKKKPMLVANPDKFAFIGATHSHDSKEYTPKLVVRQGSIGEAYAQLGGEVKFIGKPYAEVYRYALNIAAQLHGLQFEQLNRLRIAMIGDTLETDVLGARNATAELGIEIDAILAQSGISGRDMSSAGVDLANKQAIWEYCSSRAITPDHVIDKLLLDANVLF
ncbi:MAG: HAD hydrolase-like protein [Puniceicoccales bacterium]|jgi:HAD superfamily hydrolase (TIGR01459 family)|nr:HAD hydrolase-like protein [Puniceicoccales bacterium]